MLASVGTGHAWLCLTYVAHHDAGHPLLHVDALLHLGVIGAVADLGHVLELLRRKGDQRERERERERVIGRGRLTMRSILALVATMTSTGRM